MKIRTYRPTDKTAVIHLINQNSPTYFHPSEVENFIEYLDNEIEDYFVVEENEEIIGAGGINYFPEEKIARLSWDIISPIFQGKGVGRRLTEHRLGLLKENKNIEIVIVRTTQLVYKFYKRMGFKLVKVEKNFWTQGFDLYQMEIKK